MWLATRHEGFDDLRPTNRGPASLMDQWTRGYLRTGLALQTISLLFLILSHYFFQGEGLFTWEGRYTTVKMRQSDAYRLTLLVLCCTYSLGSLYILFFQSLLADDTAWSRGYRAGSKVLGFAVFFDVIASVLQVAGALNFYQNYTEAYWTHFREGNLDWIFGAGARVMHSLGWILFGVSYFLLEVYHDEGTNDWHGVINFFLFFVGGCTELTVLFLADPSIGVVIGQISLLSAWLWSMAFEQEVNTTSPRLNESELCNELEKAVDKFATGAGGPMTFNKNHQVYQTT